MATGGTYEGLLRSYRVILPIGVNQPAQSTGRSKGREVAPTVHFGEDVLHPRYGKPQAWCRNWHQLVGIPGGRQPVDGPRRGVSVIADGIARGALDKPAGSPCSSLPLMWRKLWPRRACT